MQPSDNYLSTQSELRTLPPRPENAVRRKALKSDLERQFMQAWGFQPDLRKQAWKLAGLLNDVKEFDHCTYYHDRNMWMSVIVTQPHYDPTQRLEEDLRLGKWMRPEIIPAHQWSFYHPTTGFLVICKFPCGYASVIQKLRRTI